MVGIGNKIKELRTAKSLSQKELAAYLNLTPQTISKWENHKSYPDLDLLIQLSQIFEVSTDELLGIQAPGKPNFLRTLFSKKEGKRQMTTNGKLNQELDRSNDQAQAIPRVEKVEMLGHILRIHFTDGSIKYLKSHFAEQLVDSFTNKATLKTKALYNFKHGPKHLARYRNCCTTRWLGCLESK